MENPQTELPLQLECTMYFEHNPYAYETIEGLAVRLGRSPADLEKTLRHLVSLNILEMIGEGNSAIYCYNQPNLESRVDLSCQGT
ncbi:hypothetical protein GWK91_02725 [Virgibacillus sp. MSP4-1]|uniref:hypothetical protein n=1 Tax=Virgibacillus sp. MSP4-1 TaxID=2700081 RepID=UPI0003A53B74|nr:hypothetical protein [Virgibacillus sp. MSP4-1]QHS21920.1 hypothetical protein GWK91_02725 [Virgibacillus sp. MSP4-1]